MQPKSLKTVLLIAGCSAFALLTGVGLGRMSHHRRSLVIYSDRERAEHYRSIIDNPDSTGINRRELERDANMRPLVKAGPLLIRLNESTGEYAIYDEGAPLVLKLVDSEETRIELFGQRGRTSVDVTLKYKTATRQLKKCTVITSGEKGVHGPMKDFYGDEDGDGRLDRFIDVEGGKSYVLKDLQWVLIDSSLPTNKDN